MTDDTHDETQAASPTTAASLRDEARELARRWPWSLAPPPAMTPARFEELKAKVVEGLGVMPGYIGEGTQDLLDLVNEVHRLREALRLIATGHISPSMSFAQRVVVNGEDPGEALTAEIKASRARQ